MAVSAQQTADQAVLDSVITVAVPEHIAFRYRIAGPLARGKAWVIDLAIRAALFLAIALLWWWLAGSAMAGGVLLLTWFVLDWLAGGLCEWRFAGVTPGKKALGIRVIGSDALPPGLGACLLRNVLRYADVAPSPATGLAAMILSGTFQRLGDLAAGTLVVYDDRPPAPGKAGAAEPAVEALAAGLPAPVVAALDGETARAIAWFCGRRREFHPDRRREMAEPLAAVLRHRFDLAGDTDGDRLLAAVHRRLLGADQDESANAGAAARARAFLDRRRPAWDALEQALRRRAGSAPAPLPFAALHRDACADLALAEAYHLPRATSDYLHHLVARSHGRLHRRVSLVWQRIARLILVEVPGRLYGDGCWRVALLAFFGTFILCGVLAAFLPQLAVDTLGQGQIDRMREMYASAPTGRTLDDGAEMGGFYIFNNVGIALSCFASGIFAGVGSLLWLTFNGIVLGLSFGVMATTDAATRGHFFTFVQAHGPFELTGIALSGGAGLRLGLGLIVTRGLPWRDSLKRSAREAVPLVATAATLVAMAAPIEAFVSPSDLPRWMKSIVLLACLGALALYFIGLGRRGARILRQRAAEDGR